MVSSHFQSDETHIAFCSSILAYEQHLRALKNIPLGLVAVDSLRSTESFICDLDIRRSMTLQARYMHETSPTYKFLVIEHLSGQKLFAACPHPFAGTPTSSTLCLLDVVVVLL